MKWSVSSAESGLTLLKFLKEKQEVFSSLKKLKAFIESNGCLVNGRKERFSSYLLGKGDIVECSFDGLESKEPFEEKRILYEDSSLLFYDKPPGVVSDSERWLQAVLKKRSSLQLVHRLDKDTSGVLLFSKSLQGKEDLICQFRQKTVNKNYLAIVDGNVGKPQGTIENYLGVIRQYQGQKVYGAVVPSLGKLAKTVWKKIKVGKGATLVSCFPITGRTHQLRVHLAGMGYPILGDWHYAKSFKNTFVPKRTLLHAYSLTIHHPETKTPLEIVSPVPEDMLQAMEHLQCVPSSLKHPL